MPIAAPLLIPFAEAIGIAIAGRGLMEISEQVQKFIQNNPDVSQKILSMITPQTEGLSGLLAKKKEQPTEEVKETVQTFHSKKQTFQKQRFYLLPKTAFRPDGPSVNFTQSATKSTPLFKASRASCPFNIIFDI